MAKKIIGAFIVFIIICATLAAHADLYAQHGVVLQKGHDCTVILTRDGNLWEIENRSWRHVNDKVFIVFDDCNTDDIEDDEIVEVFDE